MTNSSKEKPVSKKIKISITSWMSGQVLFEYESVDNTIAKTLEEAVNQNANLRSANLNSANLNFADLSSADLNYAKDADWAIAMTRILPEGDIIGWKKCKDGKIAKLLIPADAKRSHAFGRKCRAEYAQVLDIYKGHLKVKTAVSQYSDNFEYKVGETVKPDTKFDDNWLEECGSGIHFFITRLEAEHHEL